jgi:hypothetical protein
MEIVVSCPISLKEFSFFFRQGMERERLDLDIGGVGEVRKVG